MGIKTIITILILSGALTTSQYVTRTSTCKRSLTAPKPAGARCGAFGTLQRPSVLLEFDSAIVPIDTCRDACLDKGASCGSFSVNSNNGHCRLYKQTLNSMGFKKAPSTVGVKYYEKQCFQSTCATNLYNKITSEFSSYDDLPLPQIIIPFPIQWFNQRSAVVFMHPNGLLAFSPYASFTFRTPTTLPDNTLPSTTIAGYWTDLIINDESVRQNGLADQRMSWNVSGVPPQRYVTFTWKAAYYSNQSNYLDLDMIFEEARPGRVTLHYRDVYTPYANFTVGGQSGGIADSWGDIVISGFVLQYLPNPGGWFGTGELPN